MYFVARDVFSRATNCLYVAYQRKEKDKVDKIYDQFKRLYVLIHFICSYKRHQYLVYYKSDYTTLFLSSSMIKNVCSVAACLVSLVYIFMQPKKNCYFLSA